MSLSNILNIGVTGLTAQSQVLNVLSDNIANSTTGYKASDSQFSALVTGGDPVRASGVRASARLLADVAGPIAQTGIATNAAGRALMAIPVGPANLQDSSAGHGVADLRLVSPDTVQRYFSPTSKVSLTATLPAGLAASATSNADAGVAATLSVVDSAGKTGSVALRFLKTADNADGTSAWTVYRAGATNGDGSVAGASNASDPASWQSLGALTFTATGTLAGGAAGAPANLSMDAVGNLPAMTLDLGTYGATADGITVAQGANGVGDAITNLGQSNDGIPSGSLQSVDLTADGFVRGTFAEAKTRDFYRIPDVTVANPTDLGGGAARFRNGNGQQLVPDHRGRRGLQRLDRKPAHHHDHGPTRLLRLVQDHLHRGRDDGNPAWIAELSEP